MANNCWNWQDWITLLNERSLCNVNKSIIIIEKVIVRVAYWENVESTWPHFVLSKIHICFERSKYRWHPSKINKWTLISFVHISVAPGKLNYLRTLDERRKRKAKLWNSTMNSAIKSPIKFVVRMANVHRTMTIMLLYEKRFVNIEE